jgi:hypothetical protein
VQDIQQYHKNYKFDLIYPSKTLQDRSLPNIYNHLDPLVHFLALNLYEQFSGYVNIQGQEQFRLK